MNDAKKLEAKWIASERQYRGQVREATLKGILSPAMQAHADQLQECRRELQAEFGLLSGRLQDHPNDIPTGPTERTKPTADECAARLNLEAENEA